MKKFLVLCLSCALICGCAAKSDVDVTVGNNEMETEISQKRAVFSNNNEKFPVNMINIGGDVYYDTGKDSPSMPRCGTMDGGLNSNSVGEYEIPKESGDTNFDAPYGYQNATKMTVEMPIGDSWRIFKKIVEPDKDLSRYKYAMRLKGHLNNAVKDSEYIVLTNDMDVDFEKLARSMFSSQSTDWLDFYVIPVLEEDNWGVRLWAEDVTSRGLTIVCEQFGGNPTGDLQTGDWYTIEVMNENSEWEKVNYLPHEHEIAWNSIAYIIKKNDRCEFEIDWEWLYGALPEGHYRIGKEIMDFRSSGDFDKEIYYADFFVE